MLARYLTINAFDRKNREQNMFTEDRLKSTSESQQSHQYSLIEHEINIVMRKIERKQCRSSSNHILDIFLY
jgi:hypothetical protein